MTTRRNVMALAALLAVTAPFGNVALADQVTMVGVIKRIKLADDGKSAVVTLKNNKGGEIVTLQILDDLTLDKFKDHRIVEGDEIRAKYETQGDKNLSKSFLKTAGC
jgi:hypothetical protein